MVYQDELAGWFGSMERYAGVKEAATGPSGWRRTKEAAGHRIASSAVTRSSPISASASSAVSSLTGCARSPAKLPTRASAATAAGQPQARRGEPGREAGQRGGAVQETHREALRDAASIPGDGDQRDLKFDSGAQQVMYRVQRANHKLSAIKSLNSKVAAAFLKGDAVFARLCVCSTASSTRTTTCCRSRSRRTQQSASSAF